MDICAKIIEDLIRQNAAIPQDQREYQAKYEDPKRFYDEKQAALAKVEGKLQKQDTLLQAFNAQSFCALVNHITAFSKEDICITFRNGSEICS